MRPSRSILLQVALLVLVSVVAAQGLALAALLLTPPPPQRLMSPAEAAQVLRSPSLATARSLRVRTVAEAPRGSADPVGVLVSASLAQLLNVPPSAVRVSVLQPSAAAGEAPIDLRRSTVRVYGGTAPTVAIRQGAGALLPLASLRLPAFRAAVRGPDGRWTVVEPLEPLLSPWRVRVLGAFALSLLLLTPLAWWSARRLTRPIRVFAEAAERVGLDPDTPPLADAGPAEVRAAAAAINRLQQRVRRHVDERTALIAAIAHDLRTPLTGLRLRVENAAEPDRTRMVDDIARMQAMIGEALAFGRGSAAGADFARVDLALIATEQAAAARQRGGEVSVGSLQPALVLGDALALARATANLLENAVAYAGAAEVNVVVRDGRAVLTVDDEGPGVPESELEVVLEPFARGDPSRSRDTGGVGLGLASARATARRHGGDLTLANRSPAGLSARLSLPLAG